jgi:predicted kinase
LALATQPRCPVDHRESAPTGTTVGALGYEVGYAVAAEQLRHGLDVVAECVNPLAVTRDAWVRAAGRAGAGVLEVELVCSDRGEHRRRAESRAVDIPGLVPPTWQRIVDREYEPWTREHLVLDTAVLSAAECVAEIRRALLLSRTG